DSRCRTVHADRRPDRKHRAYSSTLARERATPFHHRVRRWLVIGCRVPGPAATGHRDDRQPTDIRVVLPARWHHLLCTGAPPGAAPSRGAPAYRHAGRLCSRVDCAWWASSQQAGTGTDAGHCYRAAEYSGGLQRLSRAGQVARPVPRQGPAGHVVAHAARPDCGPVRTLWPGGSAACAWHDHAAGLRRHRLPDVPGHRPAIAPAPALGTATWCRARCRLYPAHRNADQHTLKTTFRRSAPIQFRLRHWPHQPPDGVTAMTTNTVRIWDPFVRIFHWVLVGAFVVAYISEDHYLDIHTIAGYTVLTLVALRIVWGFIGSQHARFKDFVRPPGEALGYVKDTFLGRARRYLGHNPAGGLMIVAMLISLLATTVSGVARSEERRVGK